MNRFNTRLLLPIIIVLTAVAFHQCYWKQQDQHQSSAAATEAYVCLPCGYDCDSNEHTAPGNCEKCKMELVKKSTIHFSNIHPANLYAFIQSKGKENVVLLDVRTPEEFNGMAAEKFGRLKGALNIPVQQLKERLGELEKYRDKEMVVYCSHSHRSPAASYLLAQSGFHNVKNLQHGMHLWKQDVTDKESNDSLFVAQ